MRSLFLKSWPCVSLTVILQFPFISAAASADSGYIVRASAIHCVIEHISNYMNVGKDPLVVWLDLCPIAEPSPSDMARIAENTLPTIRTLSGNSKPVRILVLRREHLKCIQQQTEKALQPLSLADSEFLRLDLTACGDR